jgi:hypothetical protein
LAFVDDREQSSLRIGLYPGRVRANRRSVRAATWRGGDRNGRLRPARVLGVRMLAQSVL